MSKDRSLGDFVGESASELTPSEPTDEEPTDTETLGNDTDDTVDADAVDPATPTYRFDPDGAACDECNETVQKRWHDDGQFVCGECKDW